MEEKVKINISITPAWSIISQIQDKTVAFMEERGKDKDLTDATMMCVSELIENALKYGNEKPGGGNIEFELYADSEKIKITVSNGLKSKVDLENVIEHIEKIKKTDDPAKLYTERLMELMDNPKPGVSQLGLYRIAYEGEFLLDYTYDESVLTIVAERNI